jgi:hypothetical protein
MIGWFRYVWTLFITQFLALETKLPVRSERRAISTLFVVAILAAILIVVVALGYYAIVVVGVNPCNLNDAGC